MELKTLEVAREAIGPRGIYRLVSKRFILAASGAIGPRDIFGLVSETFH